MNIIAIGDELTKNIGLLKVALTNCNRLNFCGDVLVDLDRSRDEVLAVTKNVTRIFNMISLGQDTWTKEELIDLFKHELQTNLVRKYNIWIETPEGDGYSLVGCGLGCTFEDACATFFAQYDAPFDKATTTSKGCRVKQYPDE